MHHQRRRGVRPGRANRLLLQRLDRAHESRDRVPEGAQCGRVGDADDLGESGRLRSFAKRPRTITAPTYPPHMTEIGHHDDVYRSTPLEQKLAWFQNAPGLSAVEPARQFMSGAAALYTDSDAQVRATLRNLGADWTGDAATNAGATLQRAADWSQDAGAGHAAGGETVEGYGRSFESLRGQIHWDDPWAWGWNDTVTAAASVATMNPTPFLGNLTADYFTTAQQNRTNDATAVAALRAHENQTRTAVESFPNLPQAASDGQERIGD